MEGNRREFHKIQDDLKKYNEDQKRKLEVLQKKIEAEEAEILRLRRDQPKYKNKTFDQEIDSYNLEVQTQKALNEGLKVVF